MSALVQSFNAWNGEPKSNEKNYFKAFQEILEKQQIRAVMQPIVSLSDGTVIGYEALSRGPKGSFLESPDMLFSLARRFQCVWELEMICREKALAKSALLQKQELLFLNIDPLVLSDERFNSSLFQQSMTALPGASRRIVFEINEGTAIEDYENFRRILKQFRQQGYKIAIDDAGAGYAGLNTLAQTNPHFIKIDMALVRHIDKDPFKQALMKAFHDFSLLTNIKMIAEGIETIAELNELIQIGIPYGQGYFLQKPSENITPLASEVRGYIAERVRRKKRETFYTPVTMPIGEITRRDPCITPTTLGHEVIEYFNNNPKSMGVCVVEGKKPVGLLMKDRFFSNLGTQYGVALYMNRKISLVMDKDPIVVDYAMPLEQVSKMAISRSDETLYDYIIITKNGEYYGVITVRRLLEKTTQLEVNRAKHSNPLTGLPGNILIESTIKEVLAQNEPYTILYFDLDNFKPYNDVYGFESGDKIIDLTATVIQQELTRGLDEIPFVGHIGGDDFIAVLRRWNVEDICGQLSAAFDRQISSLYSESDLARGYILAKNRHGKEERFPLVSLSIAIVTNKQRQYPSAQAVAEAASLLKKKCKLYWQSCYFSEEMVEPVCNLRPVPSDLTET
ncbi:MAG: EAL domain-containing protein [Sporomusaceae bacterium]|nr:EAL domain-containing protein [Sporomusaceae bacterium]